MSKVSAKARVRIALEAEKVAKKLAAIADKRAKAGLPPLTFGKEKGSVAVGPSMRAISIKSKKERLAKERKIDMALWKSNKKQEVT